MADELQVNTAFNDGDTIDAAKFREIVEKSTIEPGAITNAKLGASAVQLANMAASSVGTSQLVDNAVTNVKVADNTLDPKKLVIAPQYDFGAGLVRTGHILCSQTDGDFEAKPLTGAITVDENGAASFGPDGVSSANIAEQAVSSRHINKFYADTYSYANHYEVSIPALTAYFDGLEFYMVALTHQTQDGATLAVQTDGGPLTSVPIVKPNGIQIKKDEIQGGQVVHLVYNGGAFVALSSLTALAALTDSKTAVGPTEIDLLANGHSTVDYVRIRVWGSGGKNLTWTSGSYYYGSSGGGGSYIDWAANGWTTRGWGQTIRLSVGQGSGASSAANKSVVEIKLNGTVYEDALIANGGAPGVAYGGAAGGVASLHANSTIQTATKVDGSAGTSSVGYLISGVALIPGGAAGNSAAGKGADAAKSAGSPFVAANGAVGLVRVDWTTVA